MFINETLRDYCGDAGIVFTRCRPWRKNGQAFVERKNGAVVRRIVGYRRLEGLEAAAALSRLYATTRLYVNFFQPSFKLASKRRDGARVSKRYHAPATPSHRLLADPRTPAAVCANAWPNWPPRWTRSAMLRYDPTRMDSMFHGSGLLSCGFAFAGRLPDPPPRTGLSRAPRRLAAHGRFRARCV